MQIRRATFIPVLSLLSILSSCINRKTSYFIKGAFVSEPKSGNYYLEMNAIAKEQYDLANKHNVIEDTVLSKDKYFIINFYTYDDDGEILKINFHDLKDSYSKTKAIPIGYIDSNGIVIQPLYPQNRTEYYLIIYQTNYLYFGSEG